MDYLVGEEKLPITRACGCVGLSRAAYYRKPMDQSAKDAPVVDMLNQIVAKHGRWGFGLCFSWMRNNGYLWNHKRVWRVYKDMRLNLPRRTKRRLPKLPKQPLIAPTQKNITWALDFMHDTLYYGKPFRTLKIVDESNRKTFAIEIYTSLPAGRIIRTLEQLSESYGPPLAIRLDNARSCTAQHYFNGARTRPRSCVTSSPESQAKMPLSSGLTEHIVVRSRKLIFLKIWISSVRLTRTGSWSTTRNAPIGRSESRHPKCSGNKQKTLHLHCLIDERDHSGDLAKIT